MGLFNNKNKRKPLFGFLNRNNFSKPDAVAEDTKPTLKRYFKLLGRNFWKLVSVSLMSIPLMAPILVIIYLYLSSPSLPTANSVVLPSLFGAHMIDASADSTIYMSLFGATLGTPNITTGYAIGMGICALFLMATFGWQNIGVTYICRSMVRGEPVFVFSDYFYAVKRNLKEAFLMGVMDFFCVGFLTFDLLFFWNLGGFWNSVGFYVICALAILWFFMRMYIYLMLVTFKLSIWKILKNALIFTMLGIKRNLMALLGLVVLTAFQIVLFPLFSLTPLGIAIPLVLPLLYYYGVCSFSSTFACYPIIDKYMIAPYRKPDETEGEVVEEAGEEPSLEQAPTKEG